MMRRVSTRLPLLIPYTVQYCNPFFCFRTLLVLLLTSCPDLAFVATETCDVPIYRLYILEST